MFVLKETLESLISFAHELQELLVQTGWINSALHYAYPTPKSENKARKNLNWKRGHGVAHNAVLFIYLFIPASVLSRVSFPEGGTYEDSWLITVYSQR